jgi:hypothetical protein
LATRLSGPKPKGIRLQLPDGRAHIENTETARLGFRNVSAGVLMAKFRLAVSRTAWRHPP